MAVSGPWARWLDAKLLEVGEERHALSIALHRVCSITRRTAVDAEAGVPEAGVGQFG
jgi:hypothetical protein